MKVLTLATGLLVFTGISIGVGAGFATFGEYQSFYSLLACYLVGLGLFSFCLWIIALIREVQAK